MLSISKRVFARRPDAAQAPLDESEILRQTRRAFAGELPIAHETLGARQALTIKPNPDHKIVVGAVARGKSAAR